MVSWFCFHSTRYVFVNVKFSFTPCGLLLHPFLCVFLSLQRLCSQARLLGLLLLLQVCRSQIYVSILNLFLKFQICISKFLLKISILIPSNHLRFRVFKTELLRFHINLHSSTNPAFVTLSLFSRHLFGHAYQKPRSCSWRAFCITSERTSCNSCQI